MKRMVWVLTVMTLLFAYSLASGGQNDSVLSRHIMEADGTTGQDTNNGSGVKTGHIQDGAVTDVKITGPISASKISSSGLNADTVDGNHAADFAPVAHNHDSIYQKIYSNVIVVAKNGGDYSDPVTAMDSITDASSTNPYLLKIMPGVYDIGNSSLMMKSFVDVEGSGESVTKIKGNIEGYSGGRGVVTFDYVSYTELRALTIEHIGGVYVADAISIGNGYPSIKNVTLLSSGGSYSTGIHIVGGPVLPIISDTTINVSGGGISTFGIYNVTGNAMLDNVKIYSTEIGVMNYDQGWGSIIRIEKSHIQGNVASVQNLNSANAYIGITQINGALQGGIFHCVGVYNANYTQITCP